MGRKELTALQLASPNIVDEALNAREKALAWKQDLRIVPLCAAIYLLCYLDRSNIGITPIYMSDIPPKANTSRKCQNLERRYQ